MPCLQDRCSGWKRSCYLRRSLQTRGKCRSQQNYCTLGVTLPSEGLPSLRGVSQGRQRSRLRWEVRAGTGSWKLKTDKFNLGNLVSSTVVLVTDPTSPDTIGPDRLPFWQEFWPDVDYCPPFRHRQQPSLPEDSPG